MHCSVKGACSRTSQWWSGAEMFQDGVRGACGQVRGGTWLKKAGKGDDRQKKEMRQELHQPRRRARAAMAAEAHLPVVEVAVRAGRGAGARVGRMRCNIGEKGLRGHTTQG